MHFSNTCFFYRRGWRGINIDPRPGSRELFDKFRPGDINLELGVAAQAGELHYFSFAEPAFNTFSAEQAERVEKRSRLEETTRVQVVRLDDILERHGFTEIDFLSVDVEGHEMEVLNSCRLSAVDVKVVVIEDLSLSLAEPGRSEVHQKLSGEGFRLEARLFASSLYIHENHLGLIRRGA